MLTLIAAGCGGQGAPEVSVRVGDGEATTGGGQFALSLQLLIGLTVLSVAPAIILLATSFTRIIIVLSLLRSAVGIPQLPPNQVLLGLALFLTLFVMAPVWSRVNADAVQPYLNGAITQEVAIERGIEPLRRFMLAQTKERELGVFLELADSPRPASAAEIPTEVLLPAFVVSELKTAFTMGFLLYIPFLVIDLVVAAALMAMGMILVSPVQIALPFKLLLFVLIDGWVLVVQSLVRSFAVV
ncbi:MAG: flagellar biosynthetic protein FliP [Anaerolinea sp.]|nr:flagellar biosynthetic protein FliP [Anaerolinea sp.]